MDIVSVVLYVLAVGILNTFFNKPDRLTKLIILLWPITIVYIIFLILEQSESEDDDDVWEK